MRTLESYEKELAKLRARHSKLFAEKRYPQMQACGDKIIGLLNTMTGRWPNWREKPTFILVILSALFFMTGCDAQSKQPVTPSCFEMFQTCTGPKPYGEGISPQNCLEGIQRLRAAGRCQ